jgi:hypothetical protein
VIHPEGDARAPDPPGLAELLHLLAPLAEAAARCGIRLRVTLDAPGGGNLVTVAVPPEPDGQGGPDDVPFIPSPFQQGILDALDGKALRTDALGAAVGDQRRLFRPRGGLQELREHGLVDHHERLGFFRPDAPPPKLLAAQQRTLTDCERDVLGIIERAGRRLSGDEVKLALQEATLLHGESTVNHALADLSRRHGLVTNRRDSRGKGYGLPEWCDG